jgi:hypothetical protein
VTALNAAGGGTLIQAGLITTAERDTFRRLLDDPSFVGNYPLLITTWGTSPIHQAERSHPPPQSSATSPVPGLAQSGAVTPTEVHVCPSPAG